MVPSPYHFRAGIAGFSRGCGAISNRLRLVLSLSRCDPADRNASFQKSTIGFGGLRRGPRRDRADAASRAIRRLEIDPRAMSPHRFRPDPSSRTLRLATFQTARHASRAGGSERRAGILAYLLFIRKKISRFLSPNEAPWARKPVALSASYRAVNLEHILRDIEPDSRDSRQIPDRLLHGRLPPDGSDNASWHTSMPGRPARPPHHRNPQFGQ